MRYAGRHGLGKLTTRLAGIAFPPYFGRVPLAAMNNSGYVAPRAMLYHRDLHLGIHVFIGENVSIFDRGNGGAVTLGDEVHLYGDTLIQTGRGGSVIIDRYTHIQPRCYFSAFLAPIHIGEHVEIAPGCAFYAHNHGTEVGELIMNQPLYTKGGVIIEDGAWLGYGVIVLDGVRIGRGAVVGAGSVVVRDIPENAIAVGTPARALKMRGDGSLPRTVV
jgi:acetyltransferase-like isoleucine patch superfamily enzyme